jgi:hypothetical protein
VANNEANRTRRVEVAIITPEPTHHNEPPTGYLNIEAYPIQSALPAESIFRKAEAPVVTGNEDAIDDFVSRLEDGLALEGADLLTFVKELGATPGVEARMLRYLEEAGA